MIKRFLQPHTLPPLPFTVAPKNFVPNCRSGTKGNQHTIHGP